MSLTHRALARRRRASALALTAVGSLLVLAAPASPVRPRRTRGG
ncbi:hypothetical protein ACIBM1_46505 [Streptomyces sp. NPDC050481]